MSKDIGLSILTMFREFQKLNRFISLDWPHGFSLASSHALIEIDAQSGVSIGSLADILSMPRTSAATIVDSLVEKALVVQLTSKSDKRQRALSLSKQGRSLLRRVDPMLDSHLAWVLSPLTPAEQNDLRSLFADLADGFQMPPTKARPHEHAFRQQLRRATRALRLIHADFLGSNIASPEWQFMAILNEGPSFGSISEIASRLQIPLTTATTIAARLRQRRFVDSGVSERDRRASTLQLNARGREFLRTVEKRMSLNIRDSICSVPKGSLQRRLSIFSKVISAPRSTR